MKCTARSSRTGKPCNKHAIHGGSVCATHGGRAPQVQEAAKRRLLEALDPAAAELVRIATTKEGVPDAVRVRAVTEIMDRAGIPRTEKQEHSGPEGGPLRLRIVFTDETSGTTQEETDEDE